MMARLFLPVAALFVTTLLLGCGGGGGQPLAPPSDEITPATHSLQSTAGRALWGYWQCGYDREQAKIITVPARTAELHINAVKLLNSTLGITVEIDPSSNPPAGYFYLTISLTHPFEGKDKLAGFDVRGILITTASELVDGFQLAGEKDPYIITADGYTRWWNPVEFPVPGLLGYTPGLYGKDPPPGQSLSAMINPYRQFADGLYMTYAVKTITLIPVTDPKGRGVFTSGSTNQRVYEIQFPLAGGVPQVAFNYAVDASWVMPSNDPPQIPIDFPPEANCEEAFVLVVDITDNTLWAVEGSNQGGGHVGLEIECWDWQGWLGGGYEDQIGPLVLLSPDCEFETGVEPSVEEPGGGRAILTASIAGKPTAEGDIPVWVGVTAPNTSYLQGAKPAPDEPVVAFTKIPINVAEPECEDNGNNDCTSAEPIAAEDTVDGLLCLDVDSTDWFSFQVPPAGAADGTIDLITYSLSNLDLLLFQDCPGSLVDESSHWGTMDEHLILDDLGAGEYYIQVLCANDGNNNLRPYTLNVEITGIGEECTKDENNEPEDALSIPIKGESNGAVCLVGDPVDWYTFTVSPGASAYGAIDLQNLGVANNDLMLFDDPSDDPLMIGTHPGTADEHLDIAFLPSGTYYLKVLASDTSPSGDRPFVLATDLTEVVAECDNEDGNNSPDEAEPIGLEDFIAGTTCFPSDPDWYGFDVGSEGADGDITLTSYELNDNDLALYDDPTAPPIEESAQDGVMDEIITVADLAEGSYFLRVTASDASPGVDQEYGLSTSLTEHVEGPTDFWLHVHIVRTTEGTNAATTPEVVEEHIDWADQFWWKYALASFTLHELSYIDNTAWLSLTLNEGTQMFEQYGDMSGVLNVFYVNDMPDMPGAAAYAWMDCQFILQDHTTAFIVVSDYAESPVLAHESGHAVGLLADMYLLDYYTCEEITFCPTGPSDIFCLETDGNWGNIMYWPIGDDMNDYWASDMDLEMATPNIDSQAENMMYFHVNYPDAFHKP